MLKPTLRSRLLLAILALARNLINLCARLLTCNARLDLVRANSISSDRLLSNLYRNTTYRKDLRTSSVITRLRLNDTIRVRAGLLRRLLNRYRRPIVILMESMSLRADRLKIINTIRALITRILKRLVCALGTARSRTLRMRLVNSARMRKSIRYIVIDSRKTYYHSAKG